MNRFLGFIAFSVLLLGNGLTMNTQKNMKDNKYVENSNDVSNTITPINEDNIKWLGRTYYNESEQVRYMNFTASGFEVTFYGTSLSMEYVATNVNDNHHRPYISVMLDGETDPNYARVIRITKSSGSVTLVEGLVKGYHTVSVYKRSECSSSHFGIKNISTDGEFVAKNDEDKLKIEIFGDSLTCGYGVESSDPTNDFTTREENGLKTYGFYAAKALDADLSLVSASGFPLYKSPYSIYYQVDNIPDMFSYADFDGNTSYSNYNSWDNSKFIPDVVVINLGANDGAYFNSLKENNATNYDSELNNFKAKYHEFLDKIYAAYPNTKVIMTSNMLPMNEDVVKSIEEVYNEYKTTHAVTYLEFTSHSIGGTLGAQWHPNEAMQLYAGAELAEAISTLDLKKLTKKNVNKEDFINLFNNFYTWNGVNPLKANYGDTIDLFEGIQVTSSIGEDYSSYLGVDTNGLVIENGVIKSVGEYSLRYYIKKNGQIISQQYSTIKVSYPSSSLIVNDDFSVGNLGWSVEGEHTIATNNFIGTNGVLSQENISLKEMRNYSLDIYVSGSGNLSIAILNDQNENIIKDFKPSYTLSDEVNNIKIVFANEFEGSYKIVLTYNQTAIISKVSLTHANINGDYNAPTFAGIEDAYILKDTTFDMLANISASDDVDGSLTYTIYDELGNVVKGEVTFTNIGDYRFFYTAFDSNGNEAVVERVIHVLSTLPSGTQLIKNGDFEDGTNHFTIDAYNGANCSYSVSNNTLTLNVEQISSSAYDPFPRIISGYVPGVAGTQGLVLENGGIYTLSFTMKAETSRQIQVFIGEILDADPWVDYYGNQYGDLITITEQFETYTIRFKVTKDTNRNCAVGICFGNIGNNPIPTTFQIQNISLIKE